MINITKKMIKIFKYGAASKRFARKICSRNFSNACDPCRKPCPPSYICQQKPKNLDIEEFMRCVTEKNHWVLKCKRPKDYKPYKNIFLFICLPLCLCMYFNVTYMTPRLKRPKFIRYEYLRIRNKPFPWDPVKQRTLFHNPYYNALPDGYEFEVPEEEEYDPRICDCEKR